jgi:hypothetical protein
MDTVHLLKMAKAIRHVHNIEQHNHAIDVCNKLAADPGPETDKQFERITNLLAALHQPA